MRKLRIWHLHNFHFTWKHENFHTIVEPLSPSLSIYPHYAWLSFLTLAKFPTCQKLHHKVQLGFFLVNFQAWSDSLFHGNKMQAYWLNQFQDSWFCPIKFEKAFEFYDQNNWSKSKPNMQSFSELLFLWTSMIWAIFLHNFPNIQLKNAEGILHHDEQQCLLCDVLQLPFPFSF